MLTAVGVARASRITRDQRVTVCFFGDGTVNIGAFNEALNLAGAAGHRVLPVQRGSGSIMGRPR